MSAPKLSGAESPSRVVVYSSKKDALLGMQESSADSEGIQQGVLATHSSIQRGMEVELCWAPSNLETAASASEALNAARVSVKYRPGRKDLDALIMEVPYQRKSKHVATATRKKERAGAFCQDIP